MKESPICTEYPVLYTATLKGDFAAPESALSATVSQKRCFCHSARFVGAKIDGHVPCLRRQRYSVIRMPNEDQPQSIPSILHTPYYMYELPAGPSSRIGDLRRSI